MAATSPHADDLVGDAVEHLPRVDQGPAVALLGLDRRWLERRRVGGLRDFGLHQHHRELAEDAQGLIRRHGAVEHAADQVGLQVGDLLGALVHRRAEERAARNIVGPELVRRRDQGVRRVAVLAVPGVLRAVPEDADEHVRSVEDRQAGDQLGDVVLICDREGHDQIGPALMEL